MPQLDLVADRGLLSDVALDGEQVALRWWAGVVSDGDLVTAGGERLGDGEADASVATGDENRTTQGISSGMGRGRAQPGDLRVASAHAL